MEKVARFVIIVCLFEIIIFANNIMEQKAIRKCQEAGHDYSYCMNIK